MRILQNKTQQFNSSQSMIGDLIGVIMGTEAIKSCDHHQQLRADWGFGTHHLCGGRYYRLYCHHDYIILYTHSGFLKLGYPQIIHLSRILNYKPSTLHYHALPPLGNVHIHIGVAIKNTHQGWFTKFTDPNGNPIFGISPENLRTGRFSAVTNVGHFQIR